jgi:outer membrane receptor protein involved in Fe transport
MRVSAGFFVAFYSHAEQYSEEDIHPNFFNTIYCYFGIPNLDNAPPFGRGSTDFENIWGAPLLPDSTSYYGEFRTVDDQTAAFGQISLKPIDRLTLTAGVRISWDAFNFGAVFEGPENNLNAPFGSSCPIVVCVFGAPGPWAPQFPVGSASGCETAVTPQYTFAFQADPTDLYYGTISKGFRPGGGELALPTVCDSELIDLGYVGSNGKAQAPLIYKSDSVWNYEVGSKNHFLDDKMTIDANVYLIKWSSVQAQIIVPVCGYGLTDNFANATSTGIDWATRLRPLDHVTFGVNVSNNKTSFDQNVGNSDGSVIIFRKGESIPQSGALWNVSALGDYQHPLSVIRFTLMLTSSGFGRPVGLCQQCVR